MSRHFFCFLLFPALLLTQACISTQPYTWPQPALKAHLSALREGCKLGETSGFSADVSFSSQGTARIEAAWDRSGNLNGQLVNPLGEDLLNFRIESNGILNTDVGLRNSPSLAMALEFLAELGTLKTRYLLCSGLYFAAMDQLAPKLGDEVSRVEETLKTQSSIWKFSSELVPVIKGKIATVDEIQIASTVKLADAIFNKKIVSILWTGKKTGRRMAPQFLTIISNQNEIKLSFLDFD
ncbi:MAG: hypothetical protein ACO3A4_06560 [Silvanigrellaceae bacterium]